MRPGLPLSFAALTLAVAASPSVATAARPAVAADEQVVQANPGATSDGKLLRAPTSRSTVAYSAYSYAGAACGGAVPPMFRRIAIHRTENAITVYVITTKEIPSTSQQICPAVAIGRTVARDRIGLGGRLGRRAIIDGSTHPSRVLYRRPTR